MGGVDLLDSLLGYYCIKVRSKKWYHCLFFHLLDMTVVNAWLLWRRANGNSVFLLNLKLTLDDLLCRYQKTFSRKHGRPSLESGKHVGPKMQIPPTAIYKDGMGHWPVFNDSKNCCKYRKHGMLTYT